MMFSYLEAIFSKLNVDIKIKEGDGHLKSRRWGGNIAAIHAS